MKKEFFQRVAFIIFAVCAILNPIFDMLPWFKFIMLAGSIFYLALGWYFPMIRDGGNPMGAELVGYIYATVFTANLLSVWNMPMADICVYYGCFISLALMIYMVVRRKTVRRDMLIQSIILFLVSPITMWV